MPNPIAKKVLMVISPKNFRDEELLDSKDIFEKNGLTVEITSDGVKESTGMMGAKTNIDKDISKVNVDEYSAIVFVGGIGVESYQTYVNPHYLALAKKSKQAGKLIGAICLAPAILANAGLLRGKNATAYSSKVPYIKTKGAKFVNKPVVIDDRIITGNGPSATKEFAFAIVSNLH